MATAGRGSIRRIILREGTQGTGPGTTAKGHHMAAVPKNGESQMARQATGVAVGKAAGKAISPNQLDTTQLVLQVPMGVGKVGSRRVDTPCHHRLPRTPRLAMARRGLRASTSMGTLQGCRLA